MSHHTWLKSVGLIGDKAAFLASGSLNVCAVDSTGNEKKGALCFTVKLVIGSVLRQVLVMGVVGMVDACNSSIPCSHRTVNLSPASTCV